MTTLLPTLSYTPEKYPNYCLSISSMLLDKIHALIPSGCSTLSIGCGTGLLEALLQERYRDTVVEGVEVQSASNLTQYLPSELIHTVSGTWDVYEGARGAGCWMFIYPRDPRLVETYLTRFAQGHLREVIWLGPIVDWEDYAPIFKRTSSIGGWRSIEIHEGAAAGLHAYEMLAVLGRTKKNRHSIDEGFA